jgi:hypothetical protein
MIFYPSPLRGRIKEGGISQGFDNHVNDSIDVLKYIVIPKSQDSKTLISQPSVTLCIKTSLLSVLSSIHLNHDSLFQTDKVYDITPQRLLSPEFVAVNPPQAELAPKHTLGIGRVVSEFSGSCSYSVHFPLSLPSPQRGEGIEILCDLNEFTSPVLLLL